MPQALDRLVRVPERPDRTHACRGKVEPFGAKGRIESPFSYWMLVTSSGRQRQEVQQFSAWVEQQAALTRVAVGEANARR